MIAYLVQAVYITYITCCTLYNTIIHHIYYIHHRLQRTASTWTSATLCPLFRLGAAIIIMTTLMIVYSHVYINVSECADVRA